ncbi:unnamed protein product [Phaedon cochleariae]|uniref:HEAT repeat-containing protein 1 n=1 Tax=Phaedon cochleariae TaxID=80249 RepID=A0A9P0DRN6_PHACE|nr:unnamed protein product [Phaedon cochleariae]
MSTSLAEQLRKLAVPQTSALKRDKKRASLLFEPKEAAGLKRDTVYQIGLEGLEELVQKNAVFDQFHDTLFHITSKDFERSVQVKDANSKLDKNIGKFLLMASPYFMLNCTHKALEWLINRYSIQEYNREDLLMLCLPYHESNIFVRVIQLMKFKDTRDSFFFLKALQKSGAHLTKLSLLNHASTNSGFLKFVTKYLIQLLKVHEKPNLLTVVFNFYCTVFTGALEYSQKMNEDQISQMLPLLLKGLNSPVPDFCAASYVVTARLVTKTTLSSILLDKLVEKISEVRVPNLKTEASLMLIVLYQSQKHYTTLPPVAVANLSEKEWLPKELQSLNEAGSLIYPFLEILIRRFTEEGVNNDLKLAQDMVKDCLDQIKIENDFVGNILQSILDVVRPKTKIAEQSRLWLTEIVQKLETQYPEAFDKEVYTILSTTDKKSMRHKKTLMKILKNTVTYRSKFDIFEKLYHPNQMIRGEALKFLSENFDSLKETDKEIILSSFSDRLKSDEVTVVKETLNVLQRTPKINKTLFKDVLILLAEKYFGDKEKWESISNMVIEMLSSNFESTDWLVFSSLLPFLLPDNYEDYRRSKKLVESNFITGHILFKSQLHKFKGVRDSESFCKIVLKILGGNSDPHILTAFQQSAVDRKVSSVFGKYLEAFLITMLLPKNYSIEIERIVDLLGSVQSIGDVFANEASVPQYIAAAGLGKLPVQGVLKLLEIIIKKTSKPQPNFHSSDFSVACNQTVHIKLVNILMVEEEKYEKLLGAALTRFFDNSAIIVEFLLNVSISENPLLRDTFKLNTLLYLKKTLNVTDIDKELLHVDHPITSYLLVLLSDPDQNVRQHVFEVFNILVEKFSKKSGTYYHFLDNLKKYTEEILMDHEQVPLIIFNILDSSSTKGKKNVSDLNSCRNHLFKIACAVESPVYLKAGVLKLFSHINTFNFLEETAKVALDILIKNPETIKGFEAKVLGHIVSRIEADVLSKLTLESDTWTLIQTCIKNDRAIIHNDSEDKICPSPLMLNQLDKEIFNKLPEPIVEKLLDTIIDISSTAQNPEVLPAASRIFKHIDLDAKLILEQLNAMRDVQSSKQDPSKKRRRVSVVPTVDILDTLDWKKGVTVLEFLQDKKKIRNVESLLQVLFELLKRCLDFDEQTAVEYPKQLLLSSILHCCSKTETVLPENVFNIEVIVQCIRASQNPQTHHHALLVLAHTAHLIPTQVLHHMMAIFTFMGSSVLRHDDAYSFQIISKIIDTIIPILVKDNQSSDIAKVLRVFVDALLDVPEHRRTPLYKQLLERIEAKENLYIFLLLVFESQVMHSSQDKQRKDGGQRRLDIAASLCREFQPETVIITSIKLLNYLQSLPDEKDDGMQVDSTSTFDLATHAPKDFRHYKYILLKFTANLLGSTEFVNQAAALSEEEELSLEPLFKEMIVNILQFIQRISRVAEKAANTPQSQYWKVVLHLSYDILDSVNGLVTSQMFLLVTKGLMVHKLATVRRRILELLNQKLQYNLQFFSDCELNEIYTLIPPLVSIIEGLDQEVEADQEIIIQTALLSLKLLVKALAQANPEKFVQILEFVTKIVRSGKAQSNVLASVVLCLAELCVQLRGHAISSLPDFMPGIIKILKQQKHEESSSLLLKSIITTVEKVIDSMPLFLSPYLEKLLVELSILSFKWESNNEEQKLQPFIVKLGNIKQKLGKTIPLRVLLPAVEQCYNTLVTKSCFNATSALMAILGEALTNLKGADITSNLPALTSFFLNALKFRTDSECALEEANLVESHIVEAFTVLILKLSENSFRPLYYKLYDWAVRSDVKSERVITFYNLSSGIAKSLKGLFVLFAGHFVNNAAQVLDASNKVKNEELYFDDDAKNALLLENVLKTLDCVFLHDNQKFVNKDRFDILMQPLVDQLENDLGGINGLLERNAQLLTPCIVDFALATADDALWKQMNYQILLKMRHATPAIRLATLRCLTEVVRKLGEDFLPLLPETIPFLAELLEDEEEEVEKACQKAVQEMEKVLGEPLQKYF